MRTKICGTGSALPERIITNHDLEQMVDTTDEWIRERTGIGERRRAEGDTVASLAATAARNALKAANRAAEEVDLIIVATCSPEWFLPCCACQVQKEIGADKAVAFDLNAACSGFLFALSTANAYITSGIYKNALIVGAEVLSKMVDYNDRGTCILFGDGAGAVFVEGCEDSAGGILGFAQGSNGMGGDVLSCKIESNEYITMDGREVYKFATRQVPACIREALEKVEYTVEDIDLFVLHQANIRILESISKSLKVSMDKIPHNLERVGNMSSAAIPVLLDEIVKSGKIEKGQKIVLSGFGAGLTYGACVLIWA